VTREWVGRIQGPGLTRHMEGFFELYDASQTRDGVAAASRRPRIAQSGCRLDRPAYNGSTYLALGLIPSTGG
jgi:hypothetical protein